MGRRKMEIEPEASIPAVRGAPKKLTIKAGYAPSETHQDIVESLASFGVAPTRIAKYLKISEKTLEEYYGDLLVTSDIEKTAKVAHALYENAIAGDQDAIKFWLKCRAGWREKQDIQITGANEGPVRITWAAD